MFWKSSLHGDQRPVSVYVYWLCQVLYISVHRCHCWLCMLLSVLCFRFCFQMMYCIKKGYYVLEIFVGVGNRDIMTKELSLIFLFFYFLHGISYPMVPF